MPPFVSKRPRDVRLIRRDVSRFDNWWCIAAKNALSIQCSSDVSSRSLIAISRTPWSMAASQIAIA